MLVSRSPLAPAARYDSEMSQQLRRSTGPILATLALLLLPLGAVYVGGYYWLGLRYPNPPGGSVRLFPYVWQQKLYQPAAKVESFLSKSDVQAGCYFYGADGDVWIYESP